MHTALTIAGSDSCGGAGIQADLKTMTVHHVYGMSAVTALTAQNTTGVSGIMEVPPAFIKEQLDRIFTDIRPDAVKTGMIPGRDQILAVADALRTYQAENIVVDPVMVATSGARLQKEEALVAMKEVLFPLATLITPNIPEAQVLAECSILSKTDMERAARRIFSECGCNVLVKGGHSTGAADDLLLLQDEVIWLHAPRIDNPNTHGTGCTLSSAIASRLALGEELADAVRGAKEYLTGALLAGLSLGKGSGPLDHAYRLEMPTL